MSGGDGGDGGDDGDRRARRMRWRWPLVVLAGAGWGLAHGVGAKPWLAAVALAPLLIALDGRRPWLRGWLFGIVAWCVAIPWIVPTITTYGLVSGLLAVILGAYDALFALAGARLWRRADALSLAALPALWVALEVARGRLLSGFPWNLAAYAWTDLPGALELSSWIGAWGVSWLLVAVNLGVARAFAARRWETAALTLLAVGALLPIAGRFARPAERAAAPGLPVAVVQPDIPNRPFFDAAATAADYRRLLDLSRALCQPGALMLWPESAAWPRQWQHDAALRLDLESLARDRGCAILLNTAYDEGSRTYNSVLLVDVRASDAGRPPLEPGPRAGSEGLRVQRADKRHLVPFGEYVPLRRLLPFVGTIARMAGDFSPATGIRLLDWHGEQLGAAVCYEVVFPGETAALVRAGASILVTVTNDGWYGDTAAPRQHLRAARFRAAENRRWLLRAAITGISAIVRPDGSLAAFADVGETAVLEARVAGRRDRSPFAHAPWLVPALAIALAGIALLGDRLRRLP
jgi:apolipoprotein N-acyltransferase